MNRRRVDISDTNPTVKDILVATNRTPPKDFDVYRLENEGDKEGPEDTWTVSAELFSDLMGIYVLHEAGIHPHI